MKKGVGAKMRKCRRNILNDVDAETKKGKNGETKNIISVTLILTMILRSNTDMEKRENEYARKRRNAKTRQQK